MEIETGKIKFFSPMSKKVFFDDLENSQLVEVSRSYYKATVNKIFKENGYELFYDKTMTKKRGYRLYRAFKIRKETPKFNPNKVLQFNPEELVI